MRPVALSLIADELGADLNELEVVVCEAAGSAYDAEAQTLPAFAAVHLLPERSLLLHHLLEVMQPDPELLAMVEADRAAEREAEEAALREDAA